MSEPYACHVCAMVAGDKVDIVARTEHFTIAAIGVAPGVVMVMSNRHDDGLADLSDDAAQSFGPVLRDVSRGIVAQGKFDLVATIHMGDNSRHTHLMLIGRMTGEPPLLDTTPLRGRLGSPEDAPRRSAILDAVASALGSA